MNVETKNNPRYESSKKYTAETIQFVIFHSKLGELIKVLGGCEPLLSYEECAFVKP